MNNLHPGLPYPTLPYPTLPYPTLPYPTLYNQLLVDSANIYFGQWQNNNLSGRQAGEIKIAERNCGLKNKENSRPPNLLNQWLAGVVS